MERRLTKPSSKVKRLLTTSTVLIQSASDEKETFPGGWVAGWLAGLSGNKTSYASQQSWRGGLRLRLAIVKLEFTLKYDFKKRTWA